MKSILDMYSMHGRMLTVSWSLKVRELYAYTKRGARQKIGHHVS